MVASEEGSVGKAGLEGASATFPRRSSFDKLRMSGGPDGGAHILREAQDERKSRRKTLILRQAQDERSPDGGAHILREAQDERKSRRKTLILRQAQDERKS